MAAMANPTGSPSPYQPMRRPRKAPTSPPPIPGSPVKDKPPPPRPPPPPPADEAAQEAPDEPAHDSEKHGDEQAARIGSRRHDLGAEADGQPQEDPHEDKHCSPVTVPGQRSVSYWTLVQGGQIALPRGPSEGYSDIRC